MAKLSVISVTADGSVLTVTSATAGGSIPHIAKIKPEVAHLRLSIPRRRLSPGVGDVSVCRLLGQNAGLMPCRDCGGVRVSASSDGSLLRTPFRCLSRPPLQ